MRRIVARLEQARQPLLPQPIELVLRKRRPQRHVGHDRQRVGEPRDRHVQADGGAVAGGARCRDRRRENRRRRRSRAPSATPAPSSSIAAVRLAAPNLPAGSSPLPLSDDEIHLHDRHFVQLDDPDRQAVRQLPLLDRRAGAAPAADRRFGGCAAIGRLRARASRRRGRTRSPARSEIAVTTSGIQTARRDAGSDVRALWRQWCGFGMVMASRLSARRSAPRGDRAAGTATAAARMSDADSARYRDRSSLNQSGSPAFGVVRVQLIRLAAESADALHPVVERRFDLVERALELVLGSAARCCSFAISSSITFCDLVDRCVPAAASPR